MGSSIRSRKCQQKIWTGALIVTTNEAFSRVKIDAQIRDQGWDVENPNAVRFEYVLPDATKADYVLCDRNGRSLAVIEAKRSATNPADAARQARAYAEQLSVPFIFLANGEEVRFWDWQIEAHPRAVKTVFSPGDLERRFATRVVRKDPRTVAIDRRIVERDYQTDCIDALTEEFHRGRRKMLVEMATGTGEDPHGRGAHQAIVRGECDHAGAVPGRSQYARQADRRCVCGALARLPVLSAAEWPALPG